MGEVTIAILSDAPTLTTGFGVTTKRIAAALHEAGWNVACFGLKARPEEVIDSTDYHIWPAERGGHWTDSLGQFLAVMRPRLLVLNMDAYNAVECLDAIRAAGWSGPVVSYVVFDGLPVGKYYLNAQRSCDAILASSHTAASYLRDSGLQVVGVAPPGVDQSVFAPYSDTASLRRQLRLADTTVIGVFATNTERKQIARVLSALPAVRDELATSRILLYLHCRPTGYWRLADIAYDLGVGENVIFPAVSAFDEMRGVPTSGRWAASTAEARPDGVLAPEVPYVDRINCCDVVVNVPHSGDIEQVILEAQACGVPLIHTDDQGVMAEAVGAGGVLLRACDVGIGRTGERTHHIAPADIAEAIVLTVRDQALRARLRRAGLENARQYTWAALETGVCNAVARCLP